MKQAIAGVAPPELQEVTTMTVWPSVAMTGFGRMLGRMMAVKKGFGIFSVGRLVTLLALPLGPLLYGSVHLAGWTAELLFGLIPGGARLYTKLGSPCAIRRYRLTNRRVSIMKGSRPQVERYVDLDRFDTIEVVVQPGQEWYHAGDLVFRRKDVETFRLLGVPRPETFRQTCLKAHLSYVGVKKALELQAAGA